ncbi:hypothetical protein GGF42_008094, partial [Coemansia sp. RSA 2424]
MFTSPSVKPRRRVAGGLQNSQEHSLTAPQELHISQDLHISQEQSLNASQENAGDDGELTLLRGDRHAVFEVGAMPPAARQLLASSNSAACGLSSAAQFAYVATADTCVVWSLAGGSGAAVHRLAMPDAESLEAPAVALVAGVGAGDVGVVAVGSLGRVRYWDRVVFGLGGAAQFHAAALALAPADRCEQIAEASAGLF